MKRFCYVKYDEQSTEMSEDLKRKCENIVASLSTLPDTDYKNEAVKHVEIAFMFMGKAIRDNQISRGVNVEHVAERTNE